jgi:hypothetical protein
MKTRLEGVQNGLIWLRFGLEQESNDGPEILHLYIGPWAKANFEPGAFI